MRQLLLLVAASVQCQELLHVWVGMLRPTCIGSWGERGGGEGGERERNGRLIQKGRSGGWGDPQAVHSFGAVQVIIVNILQLIFIAI